MLINPSLVCYKLNRFTNGTVAQRRFYMAQPILKLRKRHNNYIFANNFNKNEIKTLKCSQRILYMVFVPR